MRAAFRSRKVRCTPQRYTILDYLMRSPKHPTAEEIHKAIDRTDPTRIAAERPPVPAKTTDVPEAVCCRGKRRDVWVDIE